VVLDEGGLREVAARLADKLGEWGQETEEMAQSLAPVDTGYLRDHMFVNVYLDGAKVYGSADDPPGLAGKGVEVVIGNDAGYGRWVHDGTSDTSPDPFLATAFAAMRSRLG
jgi:HK97 gp10 family phage protein